jgi:hypothetical protein
MTNHPFHLPIIFLKPDGLTPIDKIVYVTLSLPVYYFLPRLFIFVLLRFIKFAK